ncbi:MAG: hypothetical protein H6668_01520 [Ardenticatenaceae bacterium]|nr:hypothetical protein [Ardenticatenaceae bacterium]
MPTIHLLTPKRTLMIYRPFMAALLLLLLTLSHPPTTHALPGDLDLTFGNNGMVTTQIGNGASSGQAVAIQADGKIVVPLQYADATLARYNPDGTLDSTFGTGGIATPGLGIKPAEVAIRDDGKIVVAGTFKAGSSGEFIMVAQYDGDGLLDTSFANEGILLFQHNLINVRGEAMVLQPDGKILVAGFVYSSTTPLKFITVRFTVAGELDSSFGDFIDPSQPTLGRSGRAVTSFTTGNDAVATIALQSDGKIIVAGRVDAANDRRFAIARYESDGDLDTSFGNAGVIIDERTVVSSEVRSITIQPNNYIVAMGHTNSGLGEVSGMTVMRLTIDGNFDSSFADNGLFIHPNIPSHSWSGEDLVLTSNHKIMVAYEGHGVGGGNSIGLARLSADGQLDTTYGSAGFVRKVFPNGANVYKMAVQADGKIVTVGDGSSNFMLLRFQGESFVWDGGGTTNNWSEAANWEPDMVPTVGEAVLFNATSSKNAVIDADFGGNVESLIIDAGYTGTIQQERDLTIRQRFSQADGFFNGQNHALSVGENFTLQAGTFIASPQTTVEGTVTHTGGTMQQTQQIPGSSNTEFLRITNAAGTSTKYLGAEISSDNELGAVTVSVKVVDLVNDFCTGTGATSPIYVNRCYEVQAEHSHPATLKLWAPYADVPASIRSAGRLFQYAGGTGWAELTSTGGQADKFFYAQGNISSFSHFLIAKQGEAPTGSSSNQMLATTLTLNANASISLSWASTGSPLYQIWRSQQPYTNYVLLQDDWQSTSFLDTTTDQHTNYFYEIRSMNPAITAERVGIYHFPIQAGVP